MLVGRANASNTGNASGGSSRGVRHIESPAARRPEGRIVKRSEEETT
jgi:hypothetical protein